MIGRPSTSAVPLVGRQRPRSNWIVVVLPAPLGPTKPLTTPAGRSISTESTASRGPKRLVSPLVTTLEVNAAERYCGMLSRGLAFAYAGVPAGYCQTSTDCSWRVEGKMVAALGGPPHSLAPATVRLAIKYIWSVLNGQV